MEGSGLARVRAVKRKREAEWLALPGVTGVGIGIVAGGGPGIIVSLEKESRRVRERIPASAEGVRVEFRVTGPLRTL